MRLLVHRLPIVVLAAVALVAVHACGSSYSPVTPPPGGTADVTITIVGNSGNTSFSPNPGMVPVGKTVAWTNAGSVGYGGVTHHIVADNGSFDSGDIAPGSTSAPIKMMTAGSFGYHCSIHPTMVGTLTVQ